MDARTEEEEGFAALGKRKWAPEDALAAGGGAEDGEEGQARMGTEAWNVAAGEQGVELCAGTDKSDGAVEDETWTAGELASDPDDDASPDTHADVTQSQVDFQETRKVSAERDKEPGRGTEGHARCRGQQHGSSIGRLRQNVALTVLAFILGAPCVLGKRTLPGAPACDVGMGEWVRDNRLPLYTGKSCPFVRRSHNCLRNGRKDMSFQKWRWKPAGCELQRLTPRRLALALRNKMVVVVGDSVAHALATSIVCLLHAAAPSRLEQTVMVVNGRNVPMKRSLPFNASVASVRTSHINLADPVPGDRMRRKVYLRRLSDKLVPMLKKADVVLFQAVAWWRSGRNQFILNSRLTRMPTDQAYRIGLNTLARALRNIKFRGTAFLLSPSPDHYSYPPGTPGAKPGTCRLQRPLSKYFAWAKWRTDVSLHGFYSVQKQVAAASRGLHFVDISRMSEVRADGHISNTGKLPGKRDDCLHWCEGGVTDAWLEVIYNRLLQL